MRIIIHALVYAVCCSPCIAQSTINPLWLRGGFGSSAVNCSFSPDAKYIVSSGYDQTLKFWDPQTGKTQLALSGNGAVFSKDGKYVASTLYDGSLSIVEVATKNRVLYLYGGAQNFCLSSDAKRLYTMGSDRRLIRVWDVFSKTTLFEFPVSGDYYAGMTLTADDSKIIIRGSDRRLYAYNTLNGSLIGSVLTHPYAMTQMVISPDGKTVITTSYDQIVKVWSVDSLALVKQIPLPLTYSGISFSPDGSVMAIIGSDSTLNFYAAGTWQRIRQQKYAFLPSVAFMPDNKRYYMNEGSYVRVYEIASGNFSTEINTLKPIVTWSRVSPDGSMMLTLHGDSCMRVWHLPEVSLATEIVAHRARIASLAYSPDGRTLHSCETTGLVMSYDAATGSVQRTRSFSPRCATPDVTQDLTKSYALNADSSMVIVGSGCYYRDAQNVFHYLQNLNFLRLETGEEADVMEADVPPTMVNGNPVTNYSPINTLDVSRDMSYVASRGIADQTVGVWNTKLRELRHRMGEHAYGVRSYSISADGDALITTSWQEVKLWDIATGGLIATVPGAQDWVDAAAVSRGGRFMATASGNEVRVFDNLNGVLYRRFVVDSGSAGTLQFSANGAYLISCNQSFRIWHLSTMKQLALFNDYLLNPYSYVNGPQICFAPDSKAFAIGCTEGSVMVFSIGDLINDADVETQNKTELQVVPQPASSAAEVRIYSHEEQHVQLEIRNLVGELVLARELDLRTGLQSIELPTSTLASASYICQVRTRQQLLQHHFIVMH